MDGLGGGLDVCVAVDFELYAEHHLVFTRLRERVCRFLSVGVDLLVTREVPG